MPPPGEGLETVIEFAASVEISAAEICAVSSVLSTKVVGRVLPFHCTVELEIKFVPTTLNTKSSPPCLLLLGDRVTIEGTAFEAGGGLEESPPLVLPAPPPQPRLVPRRPQTRMQNNRTACASWGQQHYLPFCSDRQPYCGFGPEGPPIDLVVSLGFVFARLNPGGETVSCAFY